MSANHTRHGTGKTAHLTKVVGNFLTTKRYGVLTMSTELVDDQHVTPQHVHTITVHWPDGDDSMLVCGGRNDLFNGVQLLIDQRPSHTVIVDQSCRRLTNTLAAGNKARSLSSRIHYIRLPRHVVRDLIEQRDSMLDPGDWPETALSALRSHAEA